MTNRKRNEMIRRCGLGLSLTLCAGGFWLAVLEAGHALTAGVLMAGAVCLLVAEALPTEEGGGRKGGGL